MGKRKDIRRDQIDTSSPTEEVTSAAVEAKASTLEVPVEATASTPTIEPGITQSAATATDGTFRAAFREAVASPPSNRFALLAASVALAAALGAVIGSFGTIGLTHSLAPSANMEATKETDANRSLQAALAQVSAQVADLKAGIETSTRLASTQFSKIAERFDRTDRAQAEPAAKLVTIGDSIARLEQRLTATTQDVTGSMAAARPETKEPPKPSILEGWVIRDIYRGRALVESRNGLFEIAPGSNLPGVGRVETITQQNGRWIVVTPKGLIVSMR
jgi:hypothetical protein